MKKIDWPLFLLNIIGPLAVSFLISFFIGDFNSYYDELKKPWPIVPSIAFPYIWSVLYILMGIANYIITVNPLEPNIKAKKLYLYQLFLNFLWTPIYFGIKTLYFGNLYTLLLLLVVGMTTMEFYKVNKKAFYLFLPYLLWCFFAYYLTFGILILNM